MTPPNRTSPSLSPRGDAEPVPDWRDQPLRTDDGVDLAARVLLPDGPPIGAVVLVHGFTATGTHHQVVAQAEALARDDFAVVTYDGRGHGASGGLCTLGDDERHDVAAAVALALQLHPRVVVVGASMGAIAALRYGATAGARDGISGVVAISGPAQWRLPLTLIGVANAVFIRTRLGRRLLSRWAKVRVSPRRNMPEPPDALVAKLDVPVTILHGRLDRIIRLAAAHRLHAAAREPRQLVIVDRMGHAFHHEARAAVCEAVRWALAEPQQGAVV